MRGERGGGGSTRRERPSTLILKSEESNLGEDIPTHRAWFCIYSEYYLSSYNHPFDISNKINLKRGRGERGEKERRSFGYHLDCFALAVSAVQYGMGD